MRVAESKETGGRKGMQCTAGSVQRVESNGQRAAVTQATGPAPHRGTTAPTGAVEVERAGGPTYYHPAALPPYRPTALNSELAVCIWIPRFALRCEELRRPEAAELAKALLAPDDWRRIWQVGPGARELGVKPGMTMSQAVGLCPALSVWEPDPVYYDERFTRLVKSLSTVSPVVEPVELGRVFVGVDGLEGLYGEPRRQVEAVEAVIGAEGWVSAARLGWARGKFTAWVAATKAPLGGEFFVTDEDRAEFLASQPIGVLPMSPETYRRLVQLSIRTVRDLAQLPEVAVVSQFGSEGRRLWRLATGDAADPVIGREEPEPIVSEIEFPHPIADLAMLGNALDRLIERALRHPRRSGWRILEVGARARQEHGASWSIHCTLKDPSADREHIGGLLKSRLAAVPPTGAVENLAIEFLAFVRGTKELQLFARDASSSARAGRSRALRAAVHEMKTRFRRTSMYRVVEVAPRSRIPERRYALIDYDP